MTTTDTLRITPRLIVGFFILALGALWTLDNLDVIESEPFTRWWPLVLILIGAVQLLNPRARKIWPFVLILACSRLTKWLAIRMSLPCPLPIVICVLTIG